MTDRRKFLQFLASACAVAARPKILLPAGAVIEPACPSGVQSSGAFRRTTGLAAREGAVVYTRYTKVTLA